jgi:hypothetical protein
MAATAPEMNRPETCLLRPGNTNCGGCGMSTGLTMLGRALEAADDSCTLVIPACGVSDDQLWRARNRGNVRLGRRRGIGRGQHP